jgi:hypothetical protein
MMESRMVIGYVPATRWVPGRCISKKNAGGQGANAGQKCPHFCPFS